MLNIWYLSIRPIIYLLNKIFLSDKLVPGIVLVISNTTWTT